MVLSTQVLATVATVSANFCQYIACNPERLPSDEALDLLFCFPFEHFHHFTLCLWTFFCFPAGDPFSASPSSDADDPHSD